MKTKVSSTVIFRFILGIRIATREPITIVTTRSRTKYRSRVRKGKFVAAYNQLAAPAAITSHMKIPTLFFCIAVISARKEGLECALTLLHFLFHSDGTLAQYAAVAECEPVAKCESVSQCEAIAKRETIAKCEAIAKCEPVAEKKCVA